MTNLQLKRVVVTGLGAITPIGNNLDEYWQGLITAKNGIGKITCFDTSDYACKIAGEVKGFDPLAYMEKKKRNVWLVFLSLRLRRVKWL